MTHEEHIERHRVLHRALDELVADWIRNGPESGRPILPSQHTVMELIKWSHEQTLCPTTRQDEAARS